MIKSNSLRAKIIENYDENGFKKLSWVDLAREQGTTEKYLLRLVRSLRTQGLLPETPESRAKRIQASINARTRRIATSPVPTPSESPATLDGIMGLSGAMTREQRIKILSQIAEHGQDISKIQAITRLEEMERAAGLKYGPPPPTTKSDMVTLLVELLSSINPEWVEAALEAYRDKANSQNSVPEIPNETTADTSDSDMGGRDEGH